MPTRFIIVLLCCQVLIGCHLGNTTRAPILSPPGLVPEGGAAADLPGPTISREEAILIALRQRNVKSVEPSNRFLRARMLHDDRSQWTVGFSNPLGGGWVVRVDASSGEVLSARTLPGR
ncbi:MAG: PepSY domain-containing protein [Planctomycetes bacterium]|nr:PepSY domain-containing protein [Planctomycetota bacterium]